MKNRIVLFVFLFFQSFAWSKKLDSTYVQTFPTCLTVKPYLDFKINRFNIYDDITGAKLFYATPQVPRMGIGIAYKWLSLMSAIAPLYRHDTEKYGESIQMDIQWNLYFKSISTDLRYQRYNGYYLSNTTAIMGHDDAAKYQRPDIDVISFGTNLRYNFNSSKYSQKAAFATTEKQLKSAGSLTIGVRWNVLDITSDSSFVPSNLHTDVINFGIDQMQIYDQGIGVGYSYSYVKRNWFATLSVMPFVAYQIFKYKMIGTNQLNPLYSLQYILQTRGAVGYNGKSSYCGITFVYDQMRSRWKDEHDIGYDFPNIKLFYSRRFEIRRKKKL